MHHALPFALAVAVVPAMAFAQQELQAEVLPFQRLIVLAPVDGRVARLQVADGAAVAAGDLLAELEAPALRVAAARARAGLEAAESAVATADLELQIARKELSIAERERKIAAEQLPQAEQRVAAAEASVAEVTTLFEAGRAPLGDLQQVRLELGRAREAWSTAGERVKAQQDRTEIGELVVRQRELAIRSAHAEREARRAELELAEQELASARITAPFAAFVHRVFATPGELTVARGTTIVELLDVSRVRLRLEIGPERARTIRPGLEVTVRDAGRSVVARIATVDAAVDPETGARGAEIVLANEGATFLVGTTVTIQLPPE